MDAKIKNIIIDEYTNVWNADSRMVNYCVKRVSDAVLLDSGMIFIFEKPTMKKDFCFGYHLSAYDSESFDEANRKVNDVETDGGHYFFKKNLEQFEDFRKRLLEDDVLLYNSSYTGRTILVEHFNSERGLRWHRPFITDDEINKMNRLTKNDIERLLEVNESEKRKMEKRLSTYLKKYGTSKLNCWSYWRDA